MDLDLTRHNRKDAAPSRSMLPSDGQARFCPWIEDSMTILSDGNVTCGLDDCDGLRSFGNIHHQSLAEIFANPEYRRLRRKLKEGQACRDCSLHQPLTGPRPRRATLPTKLVVEPTVRCNLRCPQSACFANNSPDHRTRDADDLPRDVLDTALREVGEGLEQVYFFNYGDPFMHRDAPAMIADIRRRSPAAHIVTSTNGVPLSAMKKAEAVVASGLDHIVFTISGMTQDSYARYHVNGRLESALRGLRNVIEARKAAGATRPHVSWRYLGFRWTDDFAELDAAIALAEELGVDDFCIYLTHIPEHGWSYRLAPGTQGHARYRRWINVAHGYNRPPPPRNGLFPVESLPGFGTARWTNWHGQIQAQVTGDVLTAWVSTNSPAAAVDGHAKILLRAPWGRFYRTRAPYCAWGRITLPVPGGWRGAARVPIDIFCPDAWFPADWLGVPDFRCLGVLTTRRPDGTYPAVDVPIRPADLATCRRFLRIGGAEALTPVASGRLRDRISA